MALGSPQIINSRRRRPADLFSDHIGQTTTLISHELKEKGYCYVPFLPPAGLIERVLVGWNAFLALPFEEGIKWRFGNPEDPDLGWVPRRKKDGEMITTDAQPYGGQFYDPKSFFHYRPHIISYLDDAKVSYADFIPWIEDMDNLWNYCSQRFQSIMQELDAFDMTSSIKFEKRFNHPIARSEHTLRILNYQEKLLPGHVLGKPHIDRNFATFQVTETHNALELNLPSGEQVQYKPKPGHVLAFPGLKGRDITNGGLPGIDHGIVVPKDFIPTGKEDKRQSIVFFAHVYPCPNRYKITGN